MVKNGKGGVIVGLSLVSYGPPFFLPISRSDRPRFSTRSSKAKQPLMDDAVIRSITPIVWDIGCRPAYLALRANRTPLYRSQKTTGAPPKTTLKTLKFVALCGS